MPGCDIRTPALLSVELVKMIVFFAYNCRYALFVVKQTLKIDCTLCNKHSSVLTVFSRL